MTAPIACPCTCHPFGAESGIASGTGEESCDTAAGCALPRIKAFGGQPEPCGEPSSTPSIVRGDSKIRAGAA